MHTISINDENELEPLPTCRAVREGLVEQYALEAMIALKYFTEDSPAAPAIEHVRQCEKCREWINRIIPPELLRRQSRLARYCCASMFVAVEETGVKGKNKVTFELFHGEEPCWKIGGVRSFISYCPWCGKKLPDRPFIME